MMTWIFISLYLYAVGALSLLMLAADSSLPSVRNGSLWLCPFWFIAIPVALVMAAREKTSDSEGTG